MVKVCAITYPNDNESKYKKYYETFSYELHDFQKWAIEGIVEGHHVLVTAPTGTGKSMPAEFALDYFHQKGKKTIYCSPIKSLSNQKFNDFTQKYPHISIGILTGDLRCNPNADVLVMTTEILLNKLYQIKSANQNVNSSISFEMDIENDLGCVVFDEIHYIGNEERGTVWENSIMLLPRHIQMIGLSATLDNPEKFAYWLETRGEININENNKNVYLTSKTIRAVPLIHYSFITATQLVFKSIKEKSVHDEIKGIINKPWIIKDEKNKLNDENFIKINKMLNLFESKDICVKRGQVLNQVTKYLTENEMTPAICYVFSIKQIEICSKEITTNLLEFDSKVPYIAKRECDKILRDKFSNCEEYYHLPEYLNLVSLLEKGIATHHSKMLPVLREIVEIFFARGYIKFLFATESVSIGLNLPVKTCLFTDINKHDGTSLRILQGHEYTQAAGRAGRLGLDVVGHVVHLNNLFRDVDSVSYKTMMNGKPQTLTSKFKFSYNLLLNLLDIGDNKLVNFANRSMVSGDLDNQVKELLGKQTVLNGELDGIKSYANNLRTPSDVISQYIELQQNKLSAVNKKRKDIERQLQQITENYKFIDQDKLSYQKMVIKEKEIGELEGQIETVQTYIKSGVQTVLTMLKEEGFIEGEFNDETSLKLTLKGRFACQLREIHCLVFAKLIEDKTINHLTSKQLVCLFSCFTNISVQEDNKDSYPKTEDVTLKEIVNQVADLYSKYQQKEVDSRINTGIDYSIHYDLLNYLEEWTVCQVVDSFKLFLKKIVTEN